MIVSQTSLDFSIKARDAGMKRAIDHADRVTPKWSDLVYAAFLDYLRENRGKRFQMEMFREWIGDRVPQPPHARAYGSITMRAAKAGLIRQVGFAHVKNPKAHRACAAVWIAV